MKYDYDKYVTAFSDRFLKVYVEDSVIERISDFIDDLIVEKLKEEDHIRDHQKEHKRNLTGLMGEAAIEKLMGNWVIDWSIGDSKIYNTPDIIGYNVGIKTVEKGKFPIIYKKNDYPQIMCILSDENPNLVYVCGLATPKVLNEYQDDSLILNSDIREKGYKTGFYGYEHLIPVKSLEDIEEYRQTDSFF